MQTGARFFPRKRAFGPGIVIRLILRTLPFCRMSSTSLAFMLSLLVLPFRHLCKRAGDPLLVLKACGRRFHRSPSGRRRQSGSLWLAAWSARTVTEEPRQIRQDSATSRPSANSRNLPSSRTSGPGQTVRSARRGILAGASLVCHHRAAAVRGGRPFPPCCRIVPIVRAASVMSASSSASASLTSAVRRPVSRPAHCRSALRCRIRCGWRRSASS
jgi:hypothetical protein